MSLITMDMAPTMPNDDILEEIGELEKKHNSLLTSFTNLIWKAYHEGCLRTRARCMAMYMLHHVCSFDEAQQVFSDPLIYSSNLKAETMRYVWVFLGKDNKYKTFTAEQLIAIFEGAVKEYSSNIYKKVYDMIAWEWDADEFSQVRFAESCEEDHEEGDIKAKTECVQNVMSQLNKPFYQAARLLAIPADQIEIVREQVAFEILQQMNDKP